LFVRRATIGANTFPSGHTAGSLAISFAVIGTLPWVGALLLALALSIALACIVGRYHYVIDVLTGAALALAVWAATAAGGV
jgi:undecaprenyl-diphosphatase